jgi:hypothetical protein
VLRRGRALALGLAAGAAAGCVGTVADRSFPALDERRAPILRIAVAPLGAKPEGAVDAAPVVSLRLAEAVGERGVEVVTPEQMAQAAGAVDPAAGVPALAALAKSQFGADALLLGRITRWVEREGSAAGSQQLASVGLHLELYGAPGGERLWEGDFDRTQQRFLENVLLTPRYPGGGMRLLTAEEFAQFGASELAAALPLP